MSTRLGLMPTAAQQPSTRLSNVKICAEGPLDSEIECLGSRMLIKMEGRQRSSDCEARKATPSGRQTRFGLNFQ